MIPTQSRGILKPLTGIRAVAAFLVFFYHYNIIEAKYPDSYLAKLIAEMHIGVNIFFVLSGFLITYRYFDTDKAVFNKNFFIKRFARIYPLLLILLTAAYLVDKQLAINESLSYFLNYLFNITLLSGFFSELKFTGIPQAWSLSVEETFYLLTPLLFLILRRNSKNGLLLILTLLFTGLLFVGIANIFENQLGFFDSTYFMFTYTFFGRCFEFMTGTLLAIYFLKNSKGVSKANFPFFTYGGLIGITICLIILAAFPENPDTLIFTIRKLTNGFLLPIIGVAPLFYGLIKEKSILSRLLSTPIFILLGKASYAFYLLHLGFIASWSEHLTNNYILFFLLLNLIAILLYYSIERPLNKLIRSGFTT